LQSSITPSLSVHPPDPPQPLMARISDSPVKFRIDRDNTVGGNWIFSTASGDRPSPSLPLPTDPEKEGVSSTRSRLLPSQVSPPRTHDRKFPTPFESSQSPNCLDSGIYQPPQATALSREPLPQLPLAPPNFVFMVFPLPPLNKVMFEARTRLPPICRCPPLALPAPVLCSRALPVLMRFEGPSVIPFALHRTFYFLLLPPLHSLKVFSLQPRSCCPLSAAKRFSKPESSQLSSFYVFLFYSFPNCRQSTIPKRVQRGLRHTSSPPPSFPSFFLFSVPVGRASRCGFADEA